MRSAWQTAEKERETLRQENVSLIEQVSSMRCAWETAEKERDTLKKENASLIENLSRAKSDFEYVLTIESEEKAGLLKRIETLQQQMKEEANIYEFYGIRYAFIKLAEIYEQPIVFLPIPPNGLPRLNRFRSRLY